MTDPTIQSRPASGTVPQRKLAETAHPLQDLGDFAEIGTGDDRQVQVVTRINHTRGWSNGNPGQSDPSISAPVSYPIDTPVVEVLHPPELRHAIESSPLLMQQYLFGKFDGLVDSGFLSEIKPDRPDVAASARREVDLAIAALNPQSGHDRYQLARAVLAKVALAQSPADVQPEIALARAEFENDWMPARVPAGIALAVAGDPADGAKVFAEGMRLVNTDWRCGIVSGWALLAGSARTDEERTQAYRNVMERIDTKWLDMAGDVHKAAALLARDGDTAPTYQRCVTTLAETRYRAIANGALVGAAIGASSPEERRKIYQDAEPYLHSKRWDEGSAGLIAKALTATSPEERQAVFSLATTYADRATFHNCLNGAAMLAFGILAAPSREIAHNIAAGAIDFESTW